MKDFLFTVQVLRKDLTQAAPNELGDIVVKYVWILSS